MKYKKRIKKYIFLLLAVVMVTALPAEGFAAGVTEADTYVLDRDAYEGYLYQYQSACMLGYDYNNMYGGKGVPIQAFVFNLHNSQNDTDIPAYCTDIWVTAVQGADYRRLNLEDSSYAGNAAGRIRAILKKGFYFTPMETKTEAERQTSINQRIQELEQASGVTNLTISEAIAATQGAIWRVAHGPIVSFPTFCRYTFNPRETRYTDYNDERFMAKRNNVDVLNETIEKVYEYLLSLDPIPAEQKAVSPSSFVKLQDPVWQKNSNGTYDVSVTTTVDVDMIAGDELTLTAKLNEVYEASAAIHNGSQIVTLTLEGVPSDLVSQDVTLSISGYQTAEGYFLFDASGDRGASQTLVGYDNSRLPVYAEVRAEESRILNIQKSTSDQRPISDIVFAVERVEDSRTYPNAKDHPYAKKLANPSVRSDYSLITDQNGIAYLNFTQQGLEDGVYLIVERENPKVVEPIEPFYLDVPHEDGASKDYQITLYPKNELVEDLIPKVGGRKLVKVDDSDTTIPLAGAQFQVYRSVTEDEAAAGSGVTIPGITGKVISVDFFDNEEMAGEPVTSVTSGEDGIFGIYGLTYGTYYLVETSAPEGYNLLSEPVEIVIDEDSHTEPPMMVKNRKGFILPETGGIGTSVYTLTGTVLICAACVLLYFRKRSARRKES